MEGVFIEGMEIPKGCYYRYEYCPFFTTDITGGKALCSRTGKRANYSCRPKSCPLVEIKSDMRLIDANQLEEKAYLVQGVDGRIRTVVELSDIEDAPTVLGTSGGKGGKDE